MRPDAQGMRYAAGQLRGKADRVSTVIVRLESQVGSMTFAGPAADQFRSAVDAELGRLREVRRVIGQCADLLYEGAARVEADPSGFYGAGSGAA